MGTVVVSTSGEVLSSTGELSGSSGDHVGKTVWSMLQDVSGLLDTPEGREKLQRLVGE